MSITEIASFCLVIGVTAAIPGPDIVAIVARGLKGDMKRCMPLIVGIIAGHSIWLSLAALGIVALISSFAALLVLIKAIAIIYLLYLAWQLWTAPVEPKPDVAKVEDRSALAGFSGGILIALTNPKAMVFFAAVLPTVISLDGLAWSSFLELIVVAAVTLLIVFSAWAAVAVKSAQALSTVGNRQLINKGAAAFMVGAAALVASR